MRGELKDSCFREEKLAQQVKDMKWRLDDLSLENIRLSKALKEPESRNNDLLSCQKDMVDQPFTHIMMKG